MPSNTRINIEVIHSFPQTGLVRAKKTAVEKTSEDPVCFIEDDVVLDEKNLEEIAKTFSENGDILAVGGVCRNSLNNNLVYVILHWIFYKKIFKDSRPWITWKSAVFKKTLSPSETISGGISAWRRHVLEKVQFEPKDGFHLFEDMHFCRKVVRKFGSGLYINPRATLQHFPASEGRATTGEFEAQRLREAFSLYRYHRAGFSDLLALLWLILGLTFFSALKSLRYASFTPIAGHWRGLHECLSRKKE